MESCRWVVGQEQLPLTTFLSEAGVKGQYGSKQLSQALRKGWDESAKVCSAPWVGRGTFFIGVRALKG